MIVNLTTQSKSMIAFVNDEFQRSLRRAIRDFTLRRSNLNVSIKNFTNSNNSLVITLIKKERIPSKTDNFNWDLIVGSCEDHRLDLPEVQGIPYRSEPPGNVYHFPIRNGYLVQIRTVRESLWKTILIMTMILSQFVPPHLK